MNFKQIWLLSIAISITGAPAFSQVASAASGREIPFTIGLGPSSYDVDWSHGRMYGGTIWIDWRPYLPITLLHGWGLEAEARDISLDRGSHPTNFRQDTAGVGPLYVWTRYRSFQPYGKFLVQLGSIDFQATGHPYYTHDTRTVYAPGGGFEYRVVGHFWARADYEYQFWQSLLGKTPDPQGFTIGVSYHFASSPQ